MSTLMQANRQWSSRPADQRFTSLIQLRDHFQRLRENSREVTVSNRKLHVEPTADNKGLLVTGPNGHAYTPTNWSFGQLASLGDAPAGYLRKLPAPLAADCVNYGLKFRRNVEDVGVLLTRLPDADPQLRAATGPRYGRVWCGDVAANMVEKFGDGVTGRWKVPGEFGRQVPVTVENTTIYGSDRDMWVFLADEENRIEIPNRRNGQPGSLARGFFGWNSEVGSEVLGIGTFLFDYVCQNRIVWGAQDYKEIRIRHTSAAPDRWIEEAAPALVNYANGSASNVIEAVQKAQAARLDDVDEWLTKRYGAKQAAALQARHLAEEERPIESLWDVSTAITAKARDVLHQDERVEQEREAGKVLALAK